MMVALLLGAFSHAQTPGSAQTAVLASVHQFVDCGRHKVARGGLCRSNIHHR